MTKATLNTTLGPITIDLLDNHAPKTVANFVGLAEGTKQYTDPNTGQPGSGPYYDGVIFHRVISGFMAQGGDPKGDGSGGSTLPDLKAEFTNMPYFRGTVAAARAEGPDSANSQFFIMFGPNMGLEKKYTVWGRVISGMDAVDRIAVGEPPEHPTKIVRAYLGDMAAPAVAPTVAVPAPAPAPVPAPAVTPSGG